MPTFVGRRDLFLQALCPVHGHYKTLRIQGLGEINIGGVLKTLIDCLLGAGAEHAYWNIAKVLIVFDLPQEVQGIDLQMEIKQDEMRSRSTVKVSFLAQQSEGFTSLSNAQING